MNGEITHDDRMAFITDFMSKLNGDQQVEIMEHAPASLPIEEQAKIVYEQIRKIVERNNPGLRSSQP